MYFESKFKSMDYRMLCSIQGLKLDGIDFYKIPHFVLCDDANTRNELFNNEDFLKKVGTINYPLQFENRVYAIAKINFLDEMLNWNRINITNKLTEQTIFIGQHLRDFLHFLWFVKDNSISSTMNIGHVQHEEILMYTSEISSITNRFGEVNDTLFSKSEFDLAIEMQKKYIEISPGKPIEIQNDLLLKEDEEIVPRLSRFKNVPNKEDKVPNYRIARAWTFMTKARLSDVLAMKIAFYIPVLECLFCTDSNEVTHKVSERAAFYIGSDYKERFGIYKTIKEAYALRSKYFHGQELIAKHQDIDNQKLLSLKMDYIIRKVLAKIILKDGNIFNEPNQQVFEENMTSLIFK